MHRLLIILLILSFTVRPVTAKDPAADQLRIYMENRQKAAWTRNLERAAALTPALFPDRKRLAPAESGFFPSPLGLRRRIEFYAN